MTELTDEKLIALAVAHGGDELMDFDNCVGVALDAVALRSILQAVADASYERAADGCEATALNRRAVEDWFVRKGIEHAANEIRNLKGTLPEMEG